LQNTPAIHFNHLVGTFLRPVRFKKTVVSPRQIALPCGKNLSVPFNVISLKEEAFYKLVEDVVARI
jgi:hypothetical protein